MALEIIDEKILGTIDNLQDKIDGKLPIDKLELIELINSWGRTKSGFYTGCSNIDYSNNNKILEIEECEPKECYDLSKLDVSEITNMEDVFKNSMFNGDISNWNTSNVTSMGRRFYNAKCFTQDINKWD